MYITCVYKYYIYVYFVCLSCMSRYLTRVYTCSINGYRRYICRVISLLTQHVHHLAHCHLYIYMYWQVYTCIHIYVLVCLHVYSHILYAHILCLVDMSTISRQCALSCVHVHVWVYTCMYMGIPTMYACIRIICVYTYSICTYIWHVCIYTWYIYIRILYRCMVYRYMWWYIDICDKPPRTEISIYIYIYYRCILSTCSPPDVCVCICMYV